MSFVALNDIAFLMQSVFGGVLISTCVILIFIIFSLAMLRAPALVIFIVVLPLLLTAGYLSAGQLLFLPKSIIILLGLIIAIIMTTIIGKIIN